MTLPWSHAALVFRSNSSLALLVLALAAGLAACAWLNRPTLRSLGRAGYALVALEALAAALLVLWMIDPRLRYERSDSAAGEVALLLDNSLSMATADAPGGATRYDAARALFFGGASSVDAPARRALESIGRLRVYTFGAGLEERSLTDVPDHADATGYGTDLAGALMKLGAEARGGRLRAIALASDGVQTEPGDAVAAARRTGLPVFTIGVGRSAPANGRVSAGSSAMLEDAWRDAAVARVKAPARLTVGREAVLRVEVAQQGLDGQTLPLELRQGSTTVATATVRLTTESQQAELRFTPAAAGTQTYTVALAHAAGDALPIDDAQRVTLMATDRKLRVLYLEGRLRWTYTFLHRVLAGERGVAADCAILTGGGQIVQQGEGTLKLRGGLPADAAELANYDVVILGDFPPAMLDAAGLAVLDQFVKVKKGGLLLIGGPQTLGSGQFAGSALEAMLPARFASAAAPLGSDPLAPAFTPQGRASPVFAGLQDYFPKLALRRLYAIGAAKPGAETWLQAGGRPLLLAQRYGEGRTMLLASDDLWSANLRESGAGEASPSARFWLQALGWLAQRENMLNEKDPLLMACTGESSYAAGEPVALEAWLRPPKVAGKPWGKVTAEVLRGDASASGAASKGGVASAATNNVAIKSNAPLATLDLPAPNAEGRVATSWKPPGYGAYTIRLHAAQEGEQADVDCHLTVGQPFNELARHGMDEATLREVARVSGGGYYSLAAAPGLGAGIARQSLESRLYVERDLLDSPVCFVVFIGLLAGDWIVRRRRNLI